jgi:hypothetical protein
VMDITLVQAALDAESQHTMACRCNFRISRSTRSSQGEAAVTRMQHNGPLSWNYNEAFLPRGVSVVHFPRTSSLLCVRATTSHARWRGDEPRDVGLFVIAIRGRTNKDEILTTASCCGFAVRMLCLSGPCVVDVGQHTQHA